MEERKMAAINAEAEMRQDAMESLPSTPRTKPIQMPLGDPLLLGVDASNTRVLQLETPQMMGMVMGQRLDGG
jgi:hypothetical protein